MEKKSAILLVVMTAIISGVSIYLNKFAVKGIDSDIFVFAKNIFVAVLLFSVIGIVSKFKDIKKIEKKDFLSILAIGFFGGGLPFLLYFKGLQMTSAASASFIHKTMFVFVIALSVIFLKEKISKKAIITSMILLLASFILAGPTKIFNIGNLLILSATLLWAGENTLSKKMLSKYSGNTIAFSRMFLGSMFILIYLFITGKAGKLAILSGAQITWIIITALMLFAYVMTWYNGLKHTKVSTATIILLLGSPITTILNIISGNIPGASMIIGSVLTFIGVFSFIYFTNDLKWLQKTKA